MWQEKRTVSKNSVPYLEIDFSMVVGAIKAYLELGNN